MKPFVWRKQDTHYFLRLLGVEFYFWRWAYIEKLKPLFGVHWVDGLTLHTPLVSVCILPWVIWKWIFQPTKKEA